MLDQDGLRALAVMIEDRLDGHFRWSVCSDFQALDEWCRLAVYVESGDAPA